MKEINANKETLKRNLLDLIELQYILHKTQVFFQEVRVGEGRGGAVRVGGQEGRDDARWRRVKGLCGRKGS